jgi:hypothetical protein
MAPSTSLAPSPIAQPPANFLTQPAYVAPPVVARSAFLPASSDAQATAAQSGVEAALRGASPAAAMPYALTSVRTVTTTPAKPKTVSRVKDVPTAPSPVKYPASPAGAATSAAVTPAKPVSPVASRGTSPGAYTPVSASTHQRSVCDSILREVLHLPLAATPPPPALSPAPPSPINVLKDDDDMVKELVVNLEKRDELGGNEALAGESIDATTAQGQWSRF